MADYPHLEPPQPPDPVVEALRECVAALRTSCGWIAQPPRRLILHIIADRAENILASVDNEVGDA